MVACSVAFVCGWLINHYDHFHASISHDEVNAGPQKFHSVPTPRIGGLTVVLGFFVAILIPNGLAGMSLRDECLFLLACMPALLSGLVEDLTKKIGPDIRLWSSFLSAMLAVCFFNVVIDNVSIPWINDLLHWYPIAVLFSVFAVGGIAHAVNIIDGFNGLAGMVSTLILAAIAWVSWLVGDHSLFLISVTLVGASLGFLYWNWPRGRIFAGDGGAYLWGVSIGILSVLLVGRNEEVSPWFVLLIVCYPVTETLFTIYRRKLLHKTASGMPDARHLHQLIYRRILGTSTLPKSDVRSARLNSSTSPFLWFLALIAIVPGVIFWNRTQWLMVFTAVFVMVYLWLYRSIVRFQVPLWLRRVGRQVVTRAHCVD